MRVKRSNSSGSKAPISCLASILDWICDSAWISISRSCPRSRDTFSTNSESPWRKAFISPSIRERAILISPASLTKRSTRSARTRSTARRSTSSVGSVCNVMGACAALGCASSASTAWANSAPCSTDCAATGKSVRSPDFSRSSAPVKRSKPSTNSSKSAAAGSADTCMAITWVSRIWANSPRRMTPAMRALPFNVCSCRPSSVAGALSVGAPRHMRSVSPTSGINSSASSRKMGSNCSSMSSDMTRRSLPVSIGAETGASSGFVTALNNGADACVTSARGGGATRSTTGASGW